MKRLDRMPTTQWIYGHNTPTPRAEHLPRQEQHEHYINRWDWPTLAMSHHEKKRRRAYLKALGGRLLLVLALLAVLCGWLVVSTDQYADEKKQERTEHFKAHQRIAHR